jgi:uncharacterized protein (DUF362 family)/Pyruvate/2-oxoacid:ferredoxin oxidoreductase delta subunit
MNEVAIARCEDYDYPRVKEAVARSIDLLGGISAFVKPGERVLLKVSLLMRRKPEKATTTHPAVARAVAELVKEAGGIPIIGDSPGGYHFYNRKSLESVYEGCGMIEAAEAAGAELSYDTEVVDVPYPEGRVIKLVKTIKPLLDADKVISIPRIKTHMMTVYSGAVKNLFGIIPGSYKAEYHLRFEEAEEFADLLIDLCQFAKPCLTVMDAIIGQEGYGPTNGTPRKVGLVISSASPYALDLAAADAIGLKAAQVPTIRKSMERGLCPRESELIVLGEKLDDVRVADFKKPTVKVAFNLYALFIPKFLKKRVDRFLKPKPKFDHAKCVSCGQCAAACPPKAIEMVGGKPKVDLRVCIRCFCCHELCPHGAVDISRPWFIKILLH